MPTQSKAGYIMSRLSLIISNLICLALIAALLASVGCASKTDPVTVEVRSFTAVPIATLPVVSSDVRFDTLAPLTTLAPFDVSPTPYAPPTPTPSPTRAPTNSASTPPATSANVTQPPGATQPAPWFTPIPAGQANQSIFDKCAFVGNSLFEALHAYGVVTHGAFFTTVGLNLNTVYTEPSTHGSVPVIDELNSGSYVGVLLMFGQNELGWPKPEAFIQKYAALIRDVKSRQPNARIFVTAMPPVTKALSDSSANGTTNANINYMNSLLANLSAQFGYCRFITVPDEMYDANDALPQQASGDGIHLNMTYSRIWANHICQAVAAGLTS